MYIELHSRSAFSFLEGSSLPEELAGVCAQLSMPAMALLDRDGVYGAPRFHLAAKKLGVRAHIGAEITFSPQRHRDTEGIEELKNEECRMKCEQPTTDTERRTSSPPMNADQRRSKKGMDSKAPSGFFKAARCFCFLCIPYRKGV